LNKERAILNFKELKNIYAKILKFFFLSQIYSRKPAQYNHSPEKDHSAMHLQVVVEKDQIFQQKLYTTGLAPPKKNTIMTYRIWIIWLAH
jgi:hypothetical protein